MPPMVEFQQLFARAKTGDEDAIAALWERHAAELRAVVRLRSGRAVRRKESCTDLVQSVCREVLRDLGAVQCSSESDFRGWLCKVALHKVLHKAEYYVAQRRDARREQTVPEGREHQVLQGYATIMTPSRSAAADEEIARIEAAMDALPEEQRDVIIDARLLGLSHRDIAARLGKSEEAVRKLLSRARARLGLLLSRPSE